MNLDTTDPKRNLRPIFVHLMLVKEARAKRKAILALAFLVIWWALVFEWIWLVGAP